MVKKLIALAIVFVLLGTWLHAQRVPQRRPSAPPPVTNKPALTPAQTDEMLRTLRQAMTNPPVAVTNPPVQVAVPPLTVTNPAAGIVQPSTSPAANVPPTALPSTNVPAVGAMPVPIIVPTDASSAPTFPQPTVGQIAPSPGVPAVSAPGATVQTTQPSSTPSVPSVNVPSQMTPTQVVPSPGPRLPGEPVAATPQVALPNVPPPNQDMIPQAIIQVQGMPLDQFFEIYSQVSGRTVLRPYALAGAPQGITLKAQTDWTRQEAVFAMDAVLALNLIAMIPVNDKFVKAVPEAVAGTEGAQLSQTKAGNYSETDQFITQIIELKTVRPSELAQVLATFSKIPNSITPFDNNNTVVLREHASNVKRMLEVIERVDVIRESSYKLEVIPIKYGKVGDLYNTMASLISGQAGTGFAGSSSQRSSTRQSGSLGQSSSRMGQQQYRQPGQTLQPQQTAQTPGSAQSSFQNRLQQIVSRAAGQSEIQLLEDARIVPDERSNKLLIFANKRDMEMITNIVAKVDVLLAQVLIEAIIMEVQLGDTRNLGVSMLQNPKRFGKDFTGAGVLNNGQSFLGSITNFPGASPAGFNYFGKVGDDMEVAVRAIATDSTINVVSRPRIQTSHAIPGTFDFVTTVPYPSGAVDSYGYGFGGGLGGGYSPRTIIERVDVGIRLGVTPFITPEGLVVMEIIQEASQLGRDRVIDNNPIPEINRRVAEATLTVRNKDTIMMGGFITDSKTKRKSGVPLLKDIPGLGVLFRSKDTDNSRSELIILMRATVLESPEDAAITAQNEKAQLSGIQQAEQQFQEDDQKRRKKLKTPKR